MRQSERAVLVGIVVAVAVALRWGFVATAHVPNPLRADAGEYAQYAQNLVEHGVFSLSTVEPPPPDSFRSPGYPMFLAACRLLGGSGTWLGWVIGLQVVMGGLTVLAAFGLARSCLGFTPALLAAALTALSPHLVASSAYVLTECCTAFLLTSGLWLLARAWTRGAIALVAAAAVLSAAALTNETWGIVPALAAFVVWRHQGWRRAAVVVLVGGLLPSAWMVRNQGQELARTGAQRVVASISHGSYPGMVFRDPRYRGFPYREDPEQPEFGSSWHSLTTTLARRAAEDPWRYASWYLLEKPIWLWQWDLVQGNGFLVYEVSANPYERQAVVSATGWIMRWLHGPLMLAAAAAAVWSVVRLRKQPGPLAVVALVAIGGTIAYLPVIPDPRYLQPVRPVLFVLAIAPLAAAVRWCTARCHVEPAAAASPPSI
jgi:4-amino-4-deoxy-L-arabinose transferase-like glycosyltransferase